MKGCSKSDAIWPSFMGSFAIWEGGGGLQPPPPIPTPMHCDTLLNCACYSQSFSLYIRSVALVKKFYFSSSYNKASLTFLI